jgi:integrase
MPQDLHTIPTRNKPARAMSKKSKKNLHSIMQILFDCAIQWKYLPLVRNPMELVKIKGPDLKKRVITFVTMEHYKKLLEDLELPAMVRVLIELAMCTGLRISELLGLRWDDVDWEDLTIYVQRSVVGKDEDATKTEGSEEYIPLQEDLAATLGQWKAMVPSVNGWLFGNIQTGRPFWRDSLQDDHLKPAGARIGIESLGWHNFRHTYRKMLKDLGTPLEVQMKLMRHTSLPTTMSYGKDSMLEHTRPVSAKVVAMLPKSPKLLVEKKSVAGGSTK